MNSFKSNENIHKKEDGSYYVVSANKASSVTLEWPGNKSKRKHTAILRISNKKSIQCLYLFGIEQWNRWNSDLQIIA